MLAICNKEALRHSFLITQRATCHPLLQLASRGQICPGNIHRGLEKTRSCRNWAAYPSSSALSGLAQSPQRGRVLKRSQANCSDARAGTWVSLHASKLTTPVPRKPKIDILIYYKTHCRESGVRWMPPNIATKPTTTPSS